VYAYARQRHPVGDFQNIHRGVACRPLSESSPFKASFRDRMHHRRAVPIVDYLCKLTAGNVFATVSIYLHLLPVADSASPALTATVNVSGKWRTLPPPTDRHPSTNSCDFNVIPY